MIIANYSVLLIILLLVCPMTSKLLITQRKLMGIQRVLNCIFPDPPVPLNHNCPFTFLVAVVLSAQTTDGKVNEVTKTLFKVESIAVLLFELDWLFVGQ